MRRELGRCYDGAHRTDIPKRADIGKGVPYRPPSHRKFLYGEQGGYCNGCSEHFLMRNLTVDPIIPKSRGGTDHISNLQLLCAHCNSVKGPRTHEYLMAGLIDKGWIKKRKTHGESGHQVPIGQPFQVHLSNDGRHLVQGVPSSHVVSP